MNGLIFSLSNIAQFGLILEGKLFHRGGDKHEDSDDDDSDEADEEQVVICTGMGLVLP